MGRKEKGYAGPQRRKMPRYAVRKCKIGFQRRVLGVLWTPLEKGNAIRNLNSRGVSFRSRRAVRRGARLVIVFEVPMLMQLFPPHFPVAGRVLWCDRPAFKEYYRVGMRFDRLKREQLDALRQFIQDAMINPHRTEVYE
ncbi:MAG: PilZ domain-containing protein [Planctomycetota bacterium]